MCMSNIFSDVSQAEYIEYLKQNQRTPIYRVILLSPDREEPYESLEGYTVNNSGTLNVALNQGVRRTCGFTLENSTKQYVNLFRGINIASKFKLELGDLVNGKKIYFPQGVFLFDDPQLVSRGSQRELKITGTDKYSILNGANRGILDSTFIAPLGSIIGDVYRSILALNIVNDRIEPLIDPLLEELTIPYDITKNAGSTVSDMLLDIAFSVSANLYYNVNGNLVLSPYTQDNQKGSFYDYTYLDFNYIGASKTKKNSAIYNACQLVADNTQNSLVPIISEAQNNDLSDPNSIPNLGIKKVKPITDYVKGITTQDEADLRTNWELQLASRKQSAITISGVPLYGLDVDNVIRMSDDFIDSDNERFLLNSFSLPIGTSGEMSLTGTKTII